MLNLEAFQKHFIMGQHISNLTINNSVKLKVFKIKNLM